MQNIVNCEVTCQINQHTVKCRVSGIELFCQLYYNLYTIATIVFYNSML